MKFSIFADRFLNNATQQLMADLDEGISKGENAFMLGGGNPAQIPLMQKAFQRSLINIANSDAKLATVLGNYDSPTGDSVFIHSLSELLSSLFETKVQPENVALTNGSQSSFSSLFNAFGGEFGSGQTKRILLPLAPEYIGYSDTNLQNIRLFESRLPKIELLPNNQFKYHIDFDQLALDGTKHGAVCVSRPTNPTGNVISDEELSKLSLLCKEADIPLIIDGAYGLPFPNLMFTEAKVFWNENTILCLSLSKLGLPGVRTGIVIAAPQIIDLISGANAALSLAPGSVGPAIAQDLIQHNELLQLSNEVIKPFYKNRMKNCVEHIHKIFAGLPVRIHKPEGALFLWIWFEGLPITSEDLYQRLKQRGVYTLSGHNFFIDAPKNWRHQHECLRVNYSAPNTHVIEGLNIIAELAKELFDEAT